MPAFLICPVGSRLELEQAQDIRRSVLCGELHLSRDIVADGLDAQALVLLACVGPKPVGTGRLIQREGQWAIEALAVLSPWRRQGVGRALAQALVEAATVRQGLVLCAISPKSAGLFFDACGFVAAESGPETEFGSWTKVLS